MGNFPWGCIPYVFFMWGSIYFGSMFLCVTHHIRLKLWPLPHVEESDLPTPANSPEDTRPTAEIPQRSQTQKSPLIPH